MSLRAQWTALDLDFTFEAVTSRERMWHRRTYLVRLWDSDNPGCAGIGECGLFRGLSADDVPDYERQLERLCAAPEQWRGCTLPSMHFGFETAAADLAAGGRHCWSRNTRWTQGLEGICINGLVWMGDRHTMEQRIRAKLDAGFRVLKLKIGGIGFDDECELLSCLRRAFSPQSLEIRLDANGSFTPQQAPQALGRLARYSVHSIEQPIRAGQWTLMSRLCADTPVPIALDEELIGWRDKEEAAQLLDCIKPQYIILKPTLIGGFGRADDYVSLARQRGIGWWATSALESNVGLNAIAQWVAGCGLGAAEPLPPQGLGTGQLYSNNIASPLELRGDRLFRNPAAAWDEMDNLPWR